ncbi:MAG: DMT family transporter [Bacillota bacterium]|nr:DMT family transporter [Bacillota bacterium]
MCGLVCLWGLDYVFAKAALEILQPMNLLFLKYSTGMLLVFAIKMKLDRKTLVRKKDIPFFILCSITGEILYFFCEYTAMSYIPVSLITIILAFVPAVSMIIDRLLYKRKMNYKMVIGVLMCIAGVSVVIGADFRELLQGRLIGYLLAFGAVLSWNAYNFITAEVHKHYTGPSMAFNQLFCTVLLVMPYALHTMPPIDAFTPKVIGGIIYLGLGSAGMGFLILVRGLRVLGPTISAMFSNFLPVTATIFGWVFLGETIGMLQLVGGAIVIVSSCIVITEKGKMEEQPNDREIEPDDAD